MHSPPSTNIESIRQLIYRSKYLEALEEIETQDRIEQNPREKMLLIVEKSRIFEYTGRIEEAFQLISEVKAFENYDSDLELKVRNQVTHARVMWRLARYSESRLIAEQTIGLLNEWETTDNERHSLEILLNNTLGNILRAQGYFEEALVHHRRSLILSEQLNDSINVALALNSMGIIFLNRGDYNLSLLYLLKHLNIVKRLDHTKFMAVALNNVGEIYRIRGDMEKSLEYVNQSLKIKEKLGDKLSTTYTLQNIALIENNMGVKNQALNHLEIALAYAKEMGNPLLQSICLFYLIHVNEYSEAKEQSMKYLDDLEQIAKANPEPEIVLNAKLGKALILKSQKRLKNIIEAEDLLLEIVNGEVVVHDLLIFALKHLCEIYLVELKITGREQVMNDINSIIDRLYQVGLKNNLYQTLIEALILKSKIAMVNSDFSETIKFLNEAEDLAVSKNLNTLMNFIKSEKELFQSEISKWTDLLERNQDMSSRVELVKLASYLHDVQQFLSSG